MRRLHSIRENEKSTTLIQSCTLLIRRVCVLCQASWSIYISGILIGMINIGSGGV